MIDTYLVPEKTVAHAKGDPWPIKNMTGDHVVCRKDTVSGNTSDYIDSDNDLGCSNNYQLTFTSGTANIAYTEAATIPNITIVPTVGDIWRFYGQAGAQGNPATPFPFDTPLYVVSVDSVAKTVQLSLTPGGTAITATSTTTVVPGVVLLGMSFNNPVHSSGTTASPDSYMSLLASWYNWHVALGLSVNENLRADLNAQLAWQKQNLPLYTPNTNPKYTITSQF